ncbi:MAG: M14 family zinc carboxypeptidase [Phycisphaerales bacterium]|jgi:murein tripeptide amidase MpaA
MSGFARNFSVIVAFAGLAASVLAQPSAPPGPYPGQKLVRVTTTNQREFDQVMQGCTAVWDCNIGIGPVDVQVTQAQLDALKAAGFKPQVMVSDVQALLDAEQAQIAAAHAQADIGWFSTYRTLDEINQHMLDLVAAYPGMASSFNIGQSLEGRTTYGMRFSGPDLPGNPRASRPAIFFQGCQHAREWISPMTNMYLADQMLERYATDSRVRSVLDQCEVIVIPVVNPDGYAYTWTPNNRLWRKNRRPNAVGSFGVDMNRNWDLGFGGEGSSADPTSEIFRGVSAFSEVETQHLRDFVESEPRIRSHMDFHSYSQLVMSPWAWTATLPPDFGVFAALDVAIQSSIRGVNGVTYAQGPVYTTIYPAAGNALDWSYGVRGVLGMTIELRDTGAFGFVLPADQIVPTGEENLAGALTLCEFASRPLVMELDGELPLRVDAGSGTPVAFSVMPGAGTVVGAPRLVARVGTGPWVTTPVNESTGTVYTAMLPSAACPEVVSYYFEATSSTGVVVRLPAEGGMGAYRAAGAGQDVLNFEDDMEMDRGWRVGAPGDNATAGLWQRGVPQQTAAQPGMDNSPNGVNCWMTGLAAGGGVGAFDVDGGTTTLTSPRFSAVVPRYTRAGAAVLTYARWYSNNAGANPNADSMPVQVSNDDGATWVTLEDVSENAGVWVTRSFVLENVLTPTSTMRLRFLARDLGGGSIVEAGVDDVSVHIAGCAPDLDLNQDGNADQGDVDYLINVVAGGGNDTGIDPDFNGDGNVDQGDVDALIDAIAGG